MNAAPDTPAAVGAVKLVPTALAAAVEVATAEATTTGAAVNPAVAKLTDHNPLELVVAVPIQVFAPVTWPELLYTGMLPAGPVEPLGPVGPVAPVGPAGPCAPVGPVGPAGPVDP